MAHRGRLNALVHTVGRSYESVLREFEGERSYDALVVDPEGGSGDVKYHLPASGTRVTAAGEIDVTIAPNPSHLEAVDPVVEGWTRAEQTDRSSGAGAARPDGRAAGAHPRRRGVPRPGRRRRDVQPAEPRGVLDRRHAAPDHEQPGRLHDRSGGGPVDALLERPREGLRRPDRPRQRRRPRGGAQRGPPRARLPRRVRPRLRHRPRRLPPLRAPGAGRGRVHAAAAGRADRAPADGARAVRRAARRGGRRHAGGGRRDRRRGGRSAARGARPAARVDRRAAGAAAASRRSRRPGRATPSRPPSRTDRLRA